VAHKYQTITRSGPPVLCTACTIEHLHLGVCQRRSHMFCQPRESIRPGYSSKTLGVLREHGVDDRLLLAVKSLYPCSEVCVVSVE